MKQCKDTSSLCKQNFLSHNITKFAVLVSLVLVLVLILQTPATYATDKSGNVRWELIFLSPYGGCTNYQYQMADVYDEVTSKYFDLYKFANSKYPPQCISDKKYTNYTPPQDLDLLILVYDNEMGRKELHLSDVGGLYSHMGADRTKNHVIIICDCSNFGYSDPTWTLSHELSHFITYYLGFDLSVQNEIHALSAKYNTCIEGHSENACSAVQVYGDHYFTYATVMAPYQPAIGKKLIAGDNATLTDDSSIASSAVVVEMQKEITKWWLEGRINDTEYGTVLGYAVGKSHIAAHDGKLPANILLAAGPDGQEENSTYYDLDLREDQKTFDLLKRVPFKLENTTDISKIPEWFKSRAYGWLYNQSLSDKDFVNAIKYLFGIGAGK